MNDNRHVELLGHPFCDSSSTGRFGTLTQAGKACVPDWPIGKGQCRILRNDNVSPATQHRVGGVRSSVSRYLFSRRPISHSQTRVIPFSILFLTEAIEEWEHCRPPCTPTSYPPSDRTSSDTGRRTDDIHRWRQRFPLVDGRLSSVRKDAAEGVVWHTTEATQMSARHAGTGVLRGSCKGRSLLTRLATFSRLWFVRRFPNKLSGDE